MMFTLMTNLVTSMQLPTLSWANRIVYIKLFAIFFLVIMT